MTKIVPLVLLCITMATSTCKAIGEDKEEKKVPLRKSFTKLKPDQSTSGKAIQRSSSGGAILELGLPTDVIFVLDESRNIGRTNHALLISFLTGLTDYMDYLNKFGPLGSRMGMVSFSTPGKTRILFDHLSDNSSNKNSIENLKNYIRALKFTKPENESIAAAADEGLKYALRILKGGRKEAKKIVVMVVLDSLGDQTCAVAKNAKDEGMEIMVFGITQRASKQEMECVATKRKNIFIIKSFKTAAKIGREISLKNN